MIEVFIGDRGSGKSSLAISLALKYMKKGKPVYSNLFLKGAYKLDLSDLMSYELKENAVIVIDEASTYGLGSRGTLYKKNTTDNIIEFFTMHRHYKVAHIFVISPSFTDVLPIVRDNANKIYAVKPSIMNKLGFNKYKLIGKKLDIVENCPTLIYDWIPLSTVLFLVVQPFLHMILLYIRNCLLNFGKPTKPIFSISNTHLPPCGAFLRVGVFL